MPPARKLFVILTLSALSCAAGCGARPEVRHARSGDFSAVAKDLDDRAAKGELGDAAMRDVAQAVLEHDLARFSGDDGVRRTMALEVCASPLKRALEKRADGEDDIAAASQWVLVQTGLAPIDVWTDAHRDDARPLFRAVAARGLVGSKEAKLRASRAIDDDQWVRRAAVQASGEAGCATDFAILLDSARRDPSAIVRVDAVRSLAKIAPRLANDPARADLVDRLADLWDDGDDPIRGAIARSWGSDVLFAAGGRHKLEVALGREEGHATVDAAFASMMAGGDGAIVLARQALEADPAVRAHALRLLDPERADHRKVLDDVAAKEDEDTAPLRVIAASRLALLEQRRAGMIAILVKLLARPDKVGTDAAIALADLGDARAVPRLVADLKTPSALRFSVVSALVRVGRPGEARTLVSSSDLDVRDAAACTLLATPPRS